MLNRWLHRCYVYVLHPHLLEESRLAIFLELQGLFPKLMEWRLQLSVAVSLVAGC